MSVFSVVGIIFNSRYVTTFGDFGSSVLTHTLQYVISTLYGNFGNFHFQGNFINLPIKIGHAQISAIFSRLNSKI